MICHRFINKVAHSKEKKGERGKKYPIAQWRKLKRKYDEAEARDWL